MRWVVFAGLVAGGLFWGGPGRAGPKDGNIGTYIKVEAGGKRSLKVRFKGNERACVIFIGDHDPVVDLAVYVFDEKGKLVTKDDPGGDFCAAIWYPPREGVYAIQVENRGNVWNKCWLAVK
jgi:hypothetical protein